MVGISLTQMERRVETQVRPVVEELLGTAMEIGLRGFRDQLGILLVSWLSDGHCVMV